MDEGAAAASGAAAATARQAKDNFMARRGGRSVGEDKGEEIDRGKCGFL